MTPIGYLARHPRRPDHLALFNEDGTLRTTFAVGETQADIAAKLAPYGLTVDGDGKVESSA